MRHVTRLSACLPEPMIRYACPGCQKPLKSTVANGGRRARCPTCSLRFIVPTLNVLTVVPAPAPPRPPAAPAKAEPQPTVPVGIQFPNGPSIHAQVTQNTANDLAKVTLGGILVGTGVFLAAILFGRGGRA